MSEAELSADISADFLFCVPSTLTASYPLLSLRLDCGECGAGGLWIGVLCLARFCVFGALDRVD